MWSKNQIGTFFYEKGQSSNVDAHRNTSRKSLQIRKSLQNGKTVKIEKVYKSTKIYKIKKVYNSTKLTNSCSLTTPSLFQNNTKYSITKLESQINYKIYYFPA